MDAAVDELRDELLDEALEESLADSLALAEFGAEGEAGRATMVPVCSGR